HGDDMTAGGERLGQLCAGGAGADVAEEAHVVDGFAGRAGGDEDLHGEEGGVGSEVLTQRRGDAKVAGKADALRTLRLCASALKGSMPGRGRLRRAWCRSGRALRRRVVRVRA